MGHYCHICNQHKPNEKFSGKGHSIHVCKKCSAMPKQERQIIEDRSEILSFLDQSNISKKNIGRLKILSASENQEISDLAKLVWEMAKIRSHKRKRLKYIAKANPQLLETIKKSGIILRMELC